MQRKKVIQMYLNKKRLFTKKYKSFRKTIGILYHLDTQVTNKIRFKEIKDLLYNCIVCKGSIK
jgi:hypothetical protein